MAYVVVSIDRSAKADDRRAKADDRRAKADDRSAKALAERQESWTIEECGDRDPSGARVGAILQALLAREPALTQPHIRAWMPPGLLPPQVFIEDRRPSSEVMMVRGLRIATPRLGEPDVLYWHGDLF